MPKRLTNIILAVAKIAAIPLVVVIGIINRDNYTPKVIDAFFGISEYVIKQLNKQVDSGYSGTFIFTPNSKGETGQLLFHADKGQTAKVSINVNSRGSKPSKFKILIDNVPWGNDRESPFVIIHGDVTDKLRFDVEPGGNIHSLRFIPERLAEDALIVIDCLVLVAN